MSESAGLRWTGHALVDVGIAAACVASKRNRPAELTLSDLDSISDEIERDYYDDIMSSYVSCVFMNAWFTQPTKNKPSSKENRENFNRTYVRAHRLAVPFSSVAGMTCAFSGLPALVPLVRTHLPLFSGEDVLNFRPNGQAFVPAAGVVVTSLLFAPMGARRTEGRMLVMHSEDAALQLEVARTFLEDNRRILGLMRSGNHSGKGFDPAFTRELNAWDAKNKKAKFPDAKGAKSLVVSDLVELASKADVSDLRDTASPITVITLSNSGQGPALDQFEVPGNLVRFLQRASVDPKAATAWKRVLQRYRNVSTKDPDVPTDGKPSKAKKGARKAKAKATPIAGGAGWSRNPACEDLFTIFEEGFLDKTAAARWLRRYVLGRPERAGAQRNRPPAYHATGARSWPLTELILKEILGMHESRIRAIRNFSSKIADYIQEHKAKKLRDAFLVSGKYRVVRRALINAQREAGRKGQLLFGLEEYGNVWHADRDEYLVLDLVTIGLIERLTENGYFAQNPEEELPELSEADETEDTEVIEESAE